MKKVVLVGAMLLVAGFSYAQTTIIPKAGVTLSSWSGDVDDAKSRLGFTLGAGVNFQLSELFSVQPEFNFIQKGAKWEEGDSKEQYILNYLEIPVLAKATFGSTTKFYVNAGPSLAMGLGGKLKWEEGSEEGDVDIKFGDGDDEEVFYVEKKTEIAFQLGAGVIVAEKIMIDVRYGLGLTDLYDDTDLKNNVFQFTIGVPLSIGGN